MNHILYEPTFFEKDDKILCIFGDKPFWIVGDKSLKPIVNFFLNDLSFDELQTILINDFKYSDKETKETIETIYLIFDSASLFSIQQDENYNPIDIDNNPPNPVINVTRRCNLKCSHCYADANNGQNASQELNTAELKRIIGLVMSWADSKHYDRRVLLSGGEPFIREDIMELIQYIADNNGEPFVNTNALLIKEEYMSALSKCKAELLVSLDGARESTHELIRGKNTFDPTIKKIRRLLEHGVITKLSITIHKDNLSELEEFIDLAVDLNVAQVAINPLNILSRAKDSQLQRVNLIEFYNTLSKISKKSSRHMYYVERSDYANVGAILLMNLKFQYCGVGSASLVIDYDGSVYPCYNTMISELKLGNIRYDNLDSLWKTSPLLKKLRKLNVNSFSADCQKCPVKYYCGGGCRGEAYFTNGSFISKCPYCSDMKTSIIDLMFQLSGQDNQMFQNRVHFFQEKQVFYGQRRLDSWAWSKNI
ncbi:MAG: radical SAM protein [Acetatifactor sp.]|nr:radical SAM protein [Acetatifactor sp.]